MHSVPVQFDPLMCWKDSVACKNDFSFLPSQLLEQVARPLCFALSEVITVFAQEDADDYVSVNVESSFKSRPSSPAFSRHSSLLFTCHAPS